MLNHNAHLYLSFFICHNHCQTKLSQVDPVAMEIKSLHHVMASCLICSVSLYCISLFSSPKTVSYLFVLMKNRMNPLKSILQFRNVNFCNDHNLFPKNAESLD